MTIAPDSSTSPRAGGQSAAGAPAPAAAPSPAAARRRLAAAFAVAAVSDVLSASLTFLAPVQWGVDLVTAGLLFLLLGRRWLLLPGLVAEAIPGLAVFPAWILVVGSIAVWGSVGKPGQSPGIRR